MPFWLFGAQHMCTLLMNSSYIEERNYEADPEFININNEVCSASHAHVLFGHADVHSCSQTLHSSSPYRPAVCRAFGSPPHISAAPPQRCEPLWRKRANKSCRGCRCRRAAPRIQLAAGGLPWTLTADAPAQHPHLKEHNVFSDVLISDESLDLRRYRCIKMDPFRSYEYIYALVLKCFGPIFIFHFNTFQRPN